MDMPHPSPVPSVLWWREEAGNGVDCGLAVSVWVNDTPEHFLGAPFGGFKRVGLGRKERVDELLADTRIKNVNVLLED